MGNNMGNKEFYWGPAKSSILSETVSKVIRLLMIFLIIVFMLYYISEIDSIPIKVTMQPDTFQENNNTFLLESFTKDQNLNKQNNSLAVSDYQDTNNTYIYGRIEAGCSNPTNLSKNFQVSSKQNDNIKDDIAKLTSSKFEDTNPVENENKFKSFYFVQCGVFSVKDTAEEEGQKLKRLGYNYTILAPEDDIEIYRLCLGPFKSELEADEAVKKLNSLGYAAFSFLAE